MKKILILSYYFPPCNITASNRIESWAQYFHEFGLEPIVITRKWEKEISSAADEFIASSPTHKVESFPSHKVIYTEYKPNLAERNFRDNKGLLNKAVYGITRLINRIGQNFRIHSHSYHNIYTEARKILASEHIDYIIASAYPYGLFLMAHKLKIEFPHIKWMADYRDDWTTNSMVLGSNVIQNLILKIEARSERKWLSNVSLISTASDSSKKLEKLHNMNVNVIYNGHRIEDKESMSDDTKNIRLIYSGSIYPMQDFSLLSKGMRILKDEGTNVHLTFLGGKFNTKEYSRLKLLFEGLMVDFTKRLKRSEYLETLRRAHAFILSPYADIPEITPSKMFDYFGLEKPIFLIPSDNGEMERFLTLAGLGSVCHNENDFVEAFRRLSNKKFIVKLEPENEAFLSQFHRKYQARKLAELILDT